MFGLEKNKQVEKFDFDLEIEIKDNPKKGKELLHHAEQKVEELKKEIRNAKKNDLDEYGLLLHGYTALKRVLEKIK